jgi:hypothetical protein
MDTKIEDADKVLEEYLELFCSGGEDDELRARARARADEIRKEMRAKYGHRSIAVQLVREARDEE